MSMMSSSDFAFMGLQSNKVRIKKKFASSRGSLDEPADRDDPSHRHDGREKPGRG